MHRHTDNENYSKFKTRSIIKEFKEPLPDNLESRVTNSYNDEQPLQSYEETIEEVKKKKYLPGERLLKQLGKKKAKVKPLDMKLLEKSISEVLSSF
jgi:hypothetical protein